MRPPCFETYYGVDFSGARKAGDATWVAELTPAPRRGRRPASRPFVLSSLRRMTAVCGTADRGPVLKSLVELVLASEAALWGFDFPFGLPVELFPDGTRWTNQFEFLTGWAGDAFGCGLECVRRATEKVARIHIRRTTDTDAKAPFDSYHYRIIYQTFFGMRDVIGPLRQTRGTAVLPFQYRRFRTARRVLVECCPSSVLKKLDLPHQNYKQPAGGPLVYKRRRTRHAILAKLRKLVRIPGRLRRVIMRNPGGDALDAVIAAVGAARSVAVADHLAIARHPRYPCEGHLYV
jgi:hypothetical protein